MGRLALPSRPPFAAAQNSSICLPLYNVNGQTLSAEASAIQHSELYPGVIAISAFPGLDVQEAPEALTNFFRSNDIDADCFVNDVAIKNGTVISLYVAGNPVSYEGRTDFGIRELMETPAILRSARANAMMAKASRD